MIETIVIVIGIHEQINEYGRIILLIDFILFLIFYLLIKRINFPQKRKYKVYTAFLCFFLFILANFLIFGIDSKVSIALIGGIVAYWRYELSKYNKVARRALTDLTRIFQSKKLKKQQKAADRSEP